MMTREKAGEVVNKLGFSTQDDKMRAAILVDQIYDSIVPEDADKNDPWAWVKTEYVAMFKAKNPSKGGHIKESVSRMKAMFRARPEIRKEDVILTTKLYLSQTDSRFIRLPHYFLKKGQGANAIYEFDTWYDKYLEGQEAGTGRTSAINTMQ